MDEDNRIMLEFNSERTKGELYEMTLDHYMEFVEGVIDDDIVRAHWKRKKPFDEIIVVTKSRHL